MNSSAEKQGRDAAFSAETFFSEPAGWGSVTWGLVFAFYDWMLDEGFALTTAAHRLATIKRYARLAAQADALDRLEAQMIHGFSPYAMQEGRNVDTKRKQTRIGHKKAKPIVIPAYALQQLRSQLCARDTERDRRDRVLLGLLADHGLRVGEIVALTWTHVDMKAHEIIRFRPKTGITTRQRLTRSLYDAFAELTINWVASKRMVKKQQMRWTKRGGSLAYPSENENAQWRVAGHLLRLVSSYVANGGKSATGCLAPGFW